MKRQGIYQDEAKSLSGYIPFLLFSMEVLIWHTNLKKQHSGTDRICGLHDRQQLFSQKHLQFQSIGDIVVSSLSGDAEEPAGKSGEAGDPKI